MLVALAGLCIIGGNYLGQVLRLWRDAAPLPGSNHFPCRNLTLRHRFSDYPLHQRY